MKKIVVLGGTGFVGSHVVSRLSAAGYRVKVLARRREQGRHLILLPHVEVETCDVFFESALNRALRGVDAVINLIGILHETRGHGFNRIHVELPQRVAEACKVQGVPRLLHMSALNAGLDAPSAYLRSRGAGEAAVREVACSSFGLTIFQPSVIFGRGDSFLSLFAHLLRALPVVLLAKPDARFQPVYVGDVAHAVVQSLALPETVGETFRLCGPQVYTLRQLVTLVAAHLGLSRRIIGLNDPLSMLQARCMEWLPVKLLTRDNVLSMQVDSVCGCGFPAVFGTPPATLEAYLDTLAGATPRSVYQHFRSRAGR